jgi:hypothetical protein
MKQCPQCGSIYSDDTLNFCLTDRSGLVPFAENEDTPTVIRDHRAAPETHIITDRTTVQETSIVTGGVSPIFKYLALGLTAVILLMAIGAFAAWSFLRSGSGQTTAAANTAEPTPETAARQATIENRNTANENTSTNKSSAKSPTPSPQPSATPDETKSGDDDTPPPDPGTGRIAFKKGSDSKVFSGMVTDRRSYVLRTMSGQRLSASVRSPDGCVTLDGSGTSVEFTTPSGDVSLRVVNGCDKPSPFTLSVTVR